MQTHTHTDRCTYWQAHVAADAERAHEEERKERSASFPAVCKSMTVSALITKLPPKDWILLLWGNKRSWNQLVDQLKMKWQQFWYRFDIQAVTLKPKNLRRLPLKYGYLPLHLVFYDTEFNIFRFFFFLDSWTRQNKTFKGILQLVGE